MTVGTVSRRGISAAAGVLCSALLWSPVWAQEPEEPADSTDVAAQPQEPEDRIVVTGSRIRQDPLNAGQQTLNIDAQEIDQSGLINVGDLLQRLPYSGGTFNTRFNNSGNFGFPPDGGGIGAGSTQADLRYLGPKRVLVLVDGQRWINESSASGVASAVDLNTIPKNVIERIEVLPDSASPIYGSDAIGGVINIITKQDLDGVEASAYFGAYDEADGETAEYNISMGTSSERSRIFFDVTYANSKEVNARDREISAFPTPGVGGCTPFCSSGTPQGRFVFFDPNTGELANFTLNDGVLNDGVTLPSYNPLDPGVGDDFHPFTTADRFNYSQFNLVQTPLERISIFTQASHDLTENVRFEMKALFNNRKSTNQAAPEPLFIGPDAGNGNLMDTISIDETNPFNPFGFTLDASDPNQFIFAGRRPLEAGPRIFKQVVNTWYVNGGLVGDFEFANRTFNWDVHAAFSESQANQRKFGAFNSAKLKQALGPVADCVDPCVPFNFLGGQGPNGEGSITPEMLDFVTFVQKDESDQELFDVTANITGDLIDLPAGPAAFALGVEHRHREGSFQPDAVVVAGESAGVPSTPTAGEFDVTEVYGEVIVPLLRDLPLVDYFEVQGAVRYSDYSTFEGTTVFKISGKYRPHRDFLIRGGFTEGLRAPGIGELFGSLARFDQVITDPCSDFAGLNGGTPAPANIQANCAALGVPATYEQFNQQISVQTGGNPNLEPEESDSYSVGGVYSPSWLSEKGWGDGLVEVNYYNVDVVGAIQAPNAQSQLNGCVETLDPVLCNGISRTVGGVINGFENRLQNISGIKTDGLDFRVNYMAPDTSFGRFGINVLGTWLMGFTETIATASDPLVLEREGTEVGDPERGFPEFRSTLSLDWVWNNLSARLTFRYISAIDETCPGSFYGVFVDGKDLKDLCSNPGTVPGEGTNELESRVYGDIQVSYIPPIWDERASLTIGVLNFMDTNPPECLSCALNGFDATLYDVPGAFGYVRLNLKL